MREKRQTYAAEERRRQHLARYGLTPETFAALLASQGGGCAICGTTDPAGKGWHIDHDHECCPVGRACDRCRGGILCHHCNLGIGQFRDDFEVVVRAASYLVKHRRSPRFSAVKSA